MFGFIEKRAFELNSHELSAALNTCFQEYYVPANIDAVTFERRYRAEGLDPGASIVLFNDDQPVALSFVARRGWNLHLSAFAVAPEYRGRRIGTQLLEQTRLEARARGDRSIQLEVVTENLPAMKLYQAIGFQTQRELGGYQLLAPPLGSERPVVQHLDLMGTINSIIKDEPDSFPWEVDPVASISRFPRPEVVTLDGKSVAILSMMPPNRVHVWTIYTFRNYRETGSATELLKSLPKAYPGCEISTPYAVPADVGNLLTKAGYRKMPIKQFELLTHLKPTKQSIG
jgi:GNAT superfamily N-acetyltransferase